MSNAMFGRTRKINHLKQGDIININAPFEENMKDYYNGYSPEQIRGRKFRDRFGRTAKERMVIYIGRDEQTLYYLPLTSKQKQEDLPHQYELKDNSMTPKADPNRHSYVECENLRAIEIPFGTDIPYTNRIAGEDLKNILHRVSNNTLQFSFYRDKRGYVPANMRETFEQELTSRGFTVRKETEDRKIWRNKNVEITQTKYGLIHYHVEMSKKEVTVMVSKREGRDITKERPHKKYKRTDSFRQKEKSSGKIKQDAYQKSVHLDIPLPPKPRERSDEFL